MGDAFVFVYIYWLFTNLRSQFHVEIAFITCLKPPFYMHHVGRWGYGYFILGHFVAGHIMWCTDKMSVDKIMLDKTPVKNDARKDIM